MDAFRYWSSLQGSNCPHSSGKSSASRLSVGFFEQVSGGFSALFRPELSKMAGRIESKR